MTSFCLSLTPTSTKPLVAPPRPSTAASSRIHRDVVGRCRCFTAVPSIPWRFNSSDLTCRRRPRHVVCMAPDEEKLTRRNPLDFPIEWERPKPGRRPDIFPQFSPMKTPIPPPLPYDPPEEDEEEEEEEKKKEEEEEEENPEKEDEPPKPEIS